MVLHRPIELAVVFGQVRHFSGKRFIRHVDYFRLPLDQLPTADNFTNRGSNKRPAQRQS